MERWFYGAVVFGFVIRRYSPNFRRFLIRSSLRTFGFIFYTQFLELRILSLVGVAGTYIDLQFVQQLITELILRKHSAHCLSNDPIGMLVQSPLGRFGALSSVTGVPRVAFLFPFSPREFHLFTVGDNHKVPIVHVWRVGGSVLSHQDHGNITRQTPDDFVRGVHEPPLFLNFMALCHVTSYNSQRRYLPQKPRTPGPFRISPIRTEYNCQLRSHQGTMQRAVGSRKSAVCSLQSAVGSRQSAVGSRQSDGAKLAMKFL